MAMLEDFHQATNTISDTCKYICVDSIQLIFVYTKWHHNGSIANIWTLFKSKSKIMTQLQIMIVRY
jgi:fructose 1,6-bisphosphatase